jgi:hypothetical protein
MIYSDKDLTLMTHYINIENILHQKPLALWPLRNNYLDYPFGIFKLLASFWLFFILGFNTK